MFTGLLAAVLAASTAACPSLPGADRLLARTGLTWLFLGETHGTAESPAAAADLAACAAAAGRPVVFAIEQPWTNQPAIDTYLRSNGDAAAHALLLRAPMWRRDAADGRSSVAMLDLIERLRLLARSRPLRIVAFDTPVFEKYEPGLRDRLMGTDLRRVVPTPGGLVIVYVGSAHAAKGTVPAGPKPYRAAADYLPADRTVSLLMLGNGGQAWNCQERCGVHASGNERDRKRGVDMLRAPDGSYDGLLELGMRTTASPPARSPE